MGKRSEKKLPCGKLFGLRKHDLVYTPKGTGFIKGKRSTGFFAIETILGEKIHDSVNVKKDAKRITARTTTLTNIVSISLLIAKMDTTEQST